MSEPIQEQNATAPQDPANFTATEWLREAGVAAANAAARMESSPHDAMEELGKLASKMSQQAVYRETMGDDRPLGAGSSPVLDKIYDAQMEALALQTLALVRAGGMSDAGVPAGTFMAFYEQLSSNAKARVVAPDASLSEANPPWENKLAALSVRQNFGDDAVMTSNNSGPVLAPESPPTRYERQIAVAISQAQASAMATATLEHHNPAIVKAGFDDFLHTLADMRKTVKDREFETGKSWRQQGHSTLFTKTVDAQLGAMGAAFVSIAEQAGIDPASDPRVGGGLSALASMMTQRAAQNFLAGIQTAPETKDAWFPATSVALEKERFKAGTATPNDVFTGKPKGERLVGLGQLVEEMDRQDRQAIARRGSISGNPHLVEAAGLDKPAAAAPAKWAPSMAKADIDIDLDELNKGPTMAERLVANGTHFRKTLSGFVGNFSPKKASRKLKRKAEALIERGNDLTNSFEAHLSERVGKLVESAQERWHGAKVVAAGALDGAAASAVEAASTARANFRGAVGEAKQAAGQKIGGAALAVSDRLPSAQKTQEGGRPGQVVVAQLAGLAGFLVVGAAMAPVAGVVLAAAGAAAAAYGFGKGAHAGMEGMRAALAKIPSALEGFADKLGAKRAQKTAAEPTEPAMGPASPGM